MNKGLVISIIFLLIGMSIFPVSGNLTQNHPPYPPTIYESNGLICVVTTDPDGDDIYYLIDWDDGTSSGWIGPYHSGEEACFVHTYLPGVYEIKAKAKDIYGAESDWSIPYIIIIENLPPEPPLVTGPRKVRVGEKYEWTFVSTDPEGDEITYYVDWGDECGGAEWHGPYPSGEEVTLSHIYPFQDTLIINAMARDSYGSESNFTYFEVEIPRNKVIETTLLLRFFARLQNIVKLLINL